MQCKLSLISTKTPHLLYKTDYFWDNSLTHTRTHMATKIFIELAKLNSLKINFWKQPVIEEDENKVSVILANKYKVKTKNFIIPIV